MADEGKVASLLGGNIGRYHTNTLDAAARGLQAGNAKPHVNDSAVRSLISGINDRGSVAPSPFPQIEHEAVEPTPYNRYEAQAWWDNFGDAVMQGSRDIQSGVMAAIGSSGIAADNHELQAYLAREIARNAELDEQKPRSAAWEDVADSETWGETIVKIVQNPGAVAVNLGGQVVPYAAALGLGALGGAVGGAALGLGSIATTIASSGMGGLSSYGITYASDFGRRFQQALEDSGGSFSSEEDVLQTFSNADIIDEARSKAAIYSIPIAAFDAISIGIAGQLFRATSKIGQVQERVRARIQNSGLDIDASGQLKQVRKDIADIEAEAGTRLGNVARATGELGVQGALGGAGEVGGTLAVGEEINPADVLFEIIGEFGTGPVELANAALIRRGNNNPKATEILEELLAQEEALEGQIEGQEVSEGEPSATFQEAADALPEPDISLAIDEPATEAPAEQTDQQEIPLEQQAEEGSEAQGEIDAEEEPGAQTPPEPAADQEATEAEQEATQEGEEPQPAPIDTEIPLHLIRDENLRAQEAARREAEAAQEPQGEPETSASEEAPDEAAEAAGEATQDEVVADTPESEVEEAVDEETPSDTLEAQDEAGEVADEAIPDDTPETSAQKELSNFEAEEGRLRSNIQKTQDEIDAMLTAEDPAVKRGVRDIEAEDGTVSKKALYQLPDSEGGFVIDGNGGVYEELEGGKFRKLNAEDIDSLVKTKAREIADIDQEPPPDDGAPPIDEPPEGEATETPAEQDNETQDEEQTDDDTQPVREPDEEQSGEQEAQADEEGQASQEEQETSTESVLNDKRIPASSREKLREFKRKNPDKEIRIVEEGGKTFIKIGRIRKKPFTKQSRTDANVSGQTIEMPESERLALADELQGKLSSVLGDNVAERIRVIVASPYTQNAVAEYSNIDDIRRVIVNAAMIEGLAAEHFGGDKRSKNLLAHEAMDHELIHVARDLGVFTKTEWTILSEAAKRDRKVVEFANKVYGELSGERLNEERVALMAQAHLSGQMVKKGRVARALDKLKGMLEAIRNFFKGLGFTTADQILDDFYGGRYSDRATLEYPEADGPIDSRISNLLSGAIKFIRKISAGGISSSKRKPDVPVFKKGKSIRVYHGTDQSFQEGITPDRVRGMGGLYFTTDPDVASAYAASSVGGQVWLANVKLDNPLIIDEKADDNFDQHRLLTEATARANKMGVKVSEVLKDMGYDGFAWLNSGYEVGNSPSHILVVFEPTETNIFSKESRADEDFEAEISIEITDDGTFNDRLDSLLTDSDTTEPPAESLDAEEPPHLTKEGIEQNVRDVGKHIEGLRKNIQEKIDEAQDGDLSALDMLVDYVSLTTLFPVDDEFMSDGAAALMRSIKGLVPNFRNYARRDEVVNHYLEGRGNVSVGEMVGILHSYSAHDVIDSLVRDYHIAVSSFANLFNGVRTVQDVKDIANELLAPVYDKDRSSEQRHPIFEKIEAYPYGIIDVRVFQGVIENDKWSDDYKGGDDSGRRTLARPKIDVSKRVGEDYRQGRDISSEELQKTFGLAGVAFGNYATNKEGQEHLNHAYDALSDLASIMGVSNEFIGLQGTLSIAFGGEGRGRHSAHYRPNEKVINLTKTRGDGSLAHEWGHALDYHMRDNNLDGLKKEIVDILKVKPSYDRYIDKFNNVAYRGYSYTGLPTGARSVKYLMGRIDRVSDRLIKRGDVSPFSTPSVYFKDAWVLDNRVRDTAHRAYTDPKRTANLYWSNDEELFARAFEAFIFDRLAKDGLASPYLVSDWVADGEVAESAGYRGRPYPHAGERTRSYDTFDKLVEGFDDRKFIDAGGVRLEKFDLERAQEAIEDVKRLARQFEEKERLKGQGYEAPPAGSSLPIQAEAISQHFLEGRGFKNINEARAFVCENHDRDATNKQVDEYVELASVVAAREIYNRHETFHAAWDAIVDLADNMPNLTVRTNVSATNQAYSTPLPIALYAQYKAGINSEATVYEPTAGNGALIFTASKNKVLANELNNDRYNNLLAQEYLHVFKEDATSFSPHKTMTEGVRTADVVIANPPFGPYDGSETADIDGNGVKTNKIDHHIALNALRNMKEDGKAVLIVAAPLRELDQKRRSNAYNSRDKIPFYKALYDNYNVVEHITLSGELYRKMGAAFPIDVITIDGKRPSEMSLPAVEPIPPIITTFDELKEKTHDKDIQRAGGSEDLGTDYFGTPIGERGSIGVSDEPRDGDGRQAVSHGDERDSGSGAAADRRDTEDNLDREPDEQYGGDTRELAPEGRDGRDTSPDRRRFGETDTDNDSGASLGETVSQETLQVPYQTHSSGADANLNVPTNQRDALLAAFADLKRELAKEGHDSIDSYVAAELKYKDEAHLHKHFSSAQIDALALSIRAHSKSKGFVLADQTGIGKGRVVAGMMRWSIINGKIPVFFTGKDHLYVNMYKDLTDIGIQELLGREIRILTTNNGYSPVGDGTIDDSVLKSVLRTNKSGHPALLKEVGASEEALRNRADVVFTTYNQVNARGTLETPAPRREFLEQVATYDSVFLLDESHNAGGSKQSLVVTKKDKDKGPRRAEWMRDLLGLSPNGALYSSATWAKNPHTLTLYFKTGIDSSFERPSDLIEAVASGGSALQQILTSNMVRSGLMIRREHNFEGIGYTTQIADIDESAYRPVPHILRAINNADKLFLQPAKDRISEDIKKRGAAIAGDNSIGHVGAGSASFSSVMHNLVDTLALATKAEAAGKQAVQDLKNGRSPVIAMHNTMSAITDDLDFTAGEWIDADMRTAFLRYLRRQRRYLIKEYEQEPRHEYLTDADIGTEGVKELRRIEKMIEDTDILSRLPVSPLDVMHKVITDAGYSVGEMTGRKVKLEYRDDGKARIRVDKKPEGGKRDSRKGKHGKIVQGFNDGTIDAVIINTSAAEGINLHSSREFKNQKQRSMIIVQAPPDVNTYTQIMGRVNRTNQANLPVYMNLSANIPSERRTSAMVSARMASLNASVTAARESKADVMQDTPDMKNDYGVQAIEWVLADNPIWNEALDINRNKLEDDPTRLVTQVLGRLALLDLEEQRSFYDILLGDGIQDNGVYGAVLEEAGAVGEGEVLGAGRVDTNFEVKEEEQVSPATGIGPLEDSVVMLKVESDRQGKPVKTADVLKGMAKRLGIDEESDYDAIIEAGEAFKLEQMEKTESAVARQEKTLRQNLKGDNQDKAIDSLREQHDDWKHLMRNLSIGMTGKIRIKSSANVSSVDVEYGTITNIRNVSKKGNPVALSRWALTIRSVRGISINVPMSNLFLNGVPDNAPTFREFIPLSHYDQDLILDGKRQTDKTILEAYDIFAQLPRREERHILVNNVMSALGLMKRYSSNSLGKVGFYSDENGRYVAGVMIPQGNRVAERLKKHVEAEIRSAKAAIRVLNNVTSTLDSHNGRVQINYYNDRYTLAVPESKAKGGRWWQDPDIIDATGQVEPFQTEGGQMRFITGDARAMERVIHVLINKGAVFYGNSSFMEDIAAINKDIGNDVVYSVMSQPTVGYARDKEEVKKNVRRIVSQINPKASVAFADALYGEGEALVLSGGVDGSPQSVAGKFERAKALISISLDMDRYDPELTAYHEAWHSIERLLTPEELGILKSAYPATERHSHEENVAYAFQFWAKDRKEKGASGRIFGKIMNLFRRLGNYLLGSGFKSLEDIFQAAASGNIGARSSNTIVDDSVAYAVDSMMAMAPNYSTLRSLKDHTTAFVKEKSMKARRVLQDRFIYLRESEKRHRDLLSDVRNIDELTPSQERDLLDARKAARVREALDKHFNPMKQLMVDNDISLEEGKRYLIARYAKSYNNYLRDKGEDGNIGMTNEEAEEALEAYRASAKADAYLKLGEMVDAINAEDRQNRLKAGVIGETDVEVLETKLKYYIPTWGDPINGEKQDVILDALGEGQVYGSHYRHIRHGYTENSQHEIGDVFSNLFRNYATGIAVAENNKAAVNFANFLERTGQGVINPHETIKVYNNETGNHEWRSVPITDKNRVIAFRKIVDRKNKKTEQMERRGETFYVMPYSRDLHRAWTAIPLGRRIKALRWFRQITRVMAHLNTTLALEVTMSNAFRDLQAAGIHIAEEGEEGVLRETIGGWRRSLRTLYRNARGKEPKDAEMEVWLNEYKLEGAYLDFFDMANIEEVVGALDSFRGAEQGKPDPFKKGVKATYGKMKYLYDFMEDMSRSVENAVRFSYFIALRKRKVSAKKAAHAARELTVDFGKRGEWGEVFSALYLFYGASIQGTFRAFSLINSKRGWKVMGLLVLFGFANGILNWLISDDDDDDGVLDYDEIPDHNKNRNTYLFGGALSVPLPYVYGMFPRLGEMAAELLTGRGQSLTESAGSMFALFADSANPLGQSGSLVTGITPTLGRPIVEVWGNQNFFGAPIRPIDRFGQGVPDSQLYFRGASGWSKAIAEGVNSLAGGSRVRSSGFWDTSPENLDHIAQGYGGGAFTFLRRAYDLAFTRALQGNWEGFSANDIPLVRRLVPSDNPYFHGQLYYSIRELSDTAARELRYYGKRDPEYADYVKEKFSAELGVRGLLSESEKKIRKLRGSQRELYAREDITQVERDILLGEVNDALYRAYLPVIRKFNQLGN